MKKQRPTSDHIQHLLTELVIPFYELKRDMPLPVPSRRMETDAEHSWSLSILACSLAPEIDPALNVGRVCQFAVLHDLTERYAGDTSAFADDAWLESKAEREAQALQKIRTTFAHFPWITKTLTAYEAQKEPEAQFVKAVDKIVTLWIDYLDGGEYYRERRLSKQHFVDHLVVVRKKAALHNGALRYWDEVYEKILSTPGYFYQQN